MERGVESGVESIRWERSQGVYSRRLGFRTRYDKRDEPRENDEDED